MTTTAILDACRSLRVLVIGDMILDHYIWGEVSRISPEAPVPVIHIMRETHTAGGAANVAHNIASLGGKASLIGMIGGDDAGNILTRILHQAGIDFSYHLIDPTIATIVKTRIIARTQQLCRMDREAARCCYALKPGSDIDAMLETAVDHADAIIVSDYAKGVVTQTLLDRIIALAGARGRFIAVDPKPANHLVFRGVDLITPNRHEALELAGLREPDPGDKYPLAEICRRIHARFAPKLLVITLGSEGMALCRGGEVELLLPTEEREVYDVSGAGDTVIVGSGVNVG
jgi:D-beta-D-heptose 7-phosphate kinase/D-beta-D-heptose 1-phosphate adenosyltransferase